MGLAKADTKEGRVRVALAAALLMTFTSTTCLSSTNSYGGVTVSEVVAIYDGDSFTATIADWPDIIGKRIGVRIKGVDTPELRSKCQKEKELARAAKQYTVQQLRSADTVELKNTERGKYFRILADVYVDGQNLGEQLIIKNHARPYHGGKRSGWCN